MTQPPVSLLMPNRDNAGVLDLTLERLAEHTTYPDFELIVVDDASSDGSVELLRRWRDSQRFRSFTLLEREHSGVAASLNAAAEVAGGELLVSLDGDATIETPGWLERLVDLQRSTDPPAVVTGAIVLDNGRVHAYGVNLICPEGMHDGGTEIVEPVGRRTLHSRVRRPRAKAAPPPTQPTEVDASIGCCMLFPRSLWEEAGGYDLGFSPVWFEDLDMSLTARRLGGKVYLEPSVRVLHRISMRGAPPGPLRRAARLLPQPVKDAVVRVRGADEPSAAVLERLRGHYAHWREKWGFDPLNPDMDTVRARYGDTELCWRDRVRQPGPPHASA